MQCWNTTGKNHALGREVEILIGTDSQNFSYTKVVSVICLISKGHGGIFFYHISLKSLVKDVRQKLYMETNDSLELATKLVDCLEKDEVYHQMYLDCPISIHIDAGNSYRCGKQ